MENDIRIRTTKEIIKNCFRNLLENKAFDKITVKDICEKSHISRPTFYNHYRDIYDLLEDYERDILVELDLFNVENITNNPDKLRDLIENILTHVENNKKLYQVIFKTNGNRFYELITDYSIKKILDKSKNLNIFENENEANIYFSYHSFGFLYVIEKWILEDTKYILSKKELSNILTTYMIK
ncbi:MAG: TetR/AcrR family transcriptional regulator [Lachnospiraceae bacterium]|nr:TetR/AcrR family transcriptional regulator [Lachnospiraceae bacterium]